MQYVPPRDAKTIALGLMSEQLYCLYLHYMNDFLHFMEKFRRFGMAKIAVFRKNSYYEIFFVKLLQF